MNLPDVDPKSLPGKDGSPFPHDSPKEDLDDYPILRVDLSGFQSLADSIEAGNASSSSPSSKLVSIPRWFD